MQLHSVRHREPANRWEEKTSDYIDIFCSQMNERPDELKDKYPGYLFRIISSLCDDGERRLIAEWDDYNLRLFSQTDPGSLFYTITFVV